VCNNWASVIPPDLGVCRHKTVFHAVTPGWSLHENCIIVSHDRALPCM